MTAQLLSGHCLPHPPPCNTAGKGNNALVAAAGRSIRAETGRILGLTVVGAFTDIEKFFDSVNLSTLCDEMIEHRFPKGPLVLALAQHAAPRVIKISDYVSRPISVSNSIIAGCKFSCDFTMGYCNSDLSEISDEHQDGELESFVDDNVYTVSHPSHMHATRVIVDAMTHFKAVARRLSLTLSPKGGIVASDLKVAKSISCCTVPLRLGGCCWSTSTNCERTQTPVTSATTYFASSRTSTPVF